ncbi:hypothetical protein J2Z37_003248 [Ammoniphilus resinae]|uniref:Uncharacterized protein n=1 Tax=Ammoniphilus resinae TaxID=861532 RepID=A0ABS4GTP2_9BACL|nr:hypothetical protein [Ammoniphilus resinae]
MKQGLYEQIINRDTMNQLSTLDPSYEIGKEPMDAEEARKLLSNYISTVTRWALKLIREQTPDVEAVLAQIRACNEIISTLKNNLGEEELEQLKVDEQGEILTHVYSKINSIRGITGEKVLRPATPLSQSSLFTGAHSDSRR